MSNILDKNDNLEKAICQKADAQFQFKIREWEEEGLPEPEKVLAMREENINRDIEPRRVSFLFSRAVNSEMIYRIFPAINQLIKMELDLRIANSTPFTEKRIAILREFFRSFIFKKWEHVIYEVYEQAKANVIRHTPSKQLSEQQQAELDKFFDRYWQDEKIFNIIDENFQLIDTKLQDAFAESVILAEKQKNSSAQSHSEITNLPREIIMGNKYSFGNITGSNVNVDSALNQAVQTIGTASNVGDAEKQRLTELVEQLRDELQKTPPQNKDDADALAKIAKTLIEAGTEVRPNKSMVQITADGLKKAAENIASVMPSVLTIVSSIVRIVFKSTGIPLP